MAAVETLYFALIPESVSPATTVCIIAAPLVEAFEACGTVAGFGETAGVTGRSGLLGMLVVDGLGVVEALLSS